MRSEESRLLRMVPAFLIAFLWIIVLYFAVPNRENVREVKNTLGEYCEMSVQLINFHKSALCLSKSTCKIMTNIITKMLGFRLTDKDEKFLGTPLALGRRKSTSFDSLVV